MREEQFETAFPIDGFKTDPSRLGMELRDWFAGQALAGLMHYEHWKACVFRNVEPCESLTDLSYQMADAMLKRRQA